VFEAHINTYFIQ